MFFGFRGLSVVMGMVALGVIHGLPVGNETASGPTPVEEAVLKSPWYGLLDNDSIRQLLCHTNRSLTESGLTFQGDCRRCMGLGNETHPRVWLLRMIPVVSECWGWEELPSPSTGEYFTAHFVCHYEDCGHRFVPAKYTTQDVNCHMRPHLPDDLISATRADSCLRPELYIRNVTSYLRKDDPLGWWDSFWGRVAPLHHYLNV